MATGKPIRTILVALLLLAATTAAPVLQVVHGARSSDNCEFCHLGHLPAIQPDSEPHLTEPAVVAELELVDNGIPGYSVSLCARPPRGPPA